MRALPGSRTRSTQWTDDSLESVHSNEWCTGEDSNLRTSLGGADLQSAGFNHSPTCAENADCSALHSSGSLRQSLQHALGGLCRSRYSSIRNGKRAKLLLRIPHRNWKSFLGVPLETCQCRRAAQTSCLFRKPDPGAGEGI